MEQAVSCIHWWIQRDENQQVESYWARWAVAVAVAAVAVAEVASALAEGASGVTVAAG